MSHWTIRSVVIQALHSLYWKFCLILFITYRSISVSSTHSDKWYSLCLSLEDPDIWWSLFPGWSKEVPLDSHINHSRSTARWITTVLCHYTNLKASLHFNYWITLFPISHGLPLKIIIGVLLILTKVCNKKHIHVSWNTPTSEFLWMNVSKVYNFCLCRQISSNRFYTVKRCGKICLTR